MAILALPLWIHVFMSVPLHDISPQETNTLIKEQSLLHACSPDCLLNLLTFIMHLLRDRNCTKFWVNDKRYSPCFQRVHSLLKEVTS